MVSGEFKLNLLRRLTTSLRQHMNVRWRPTADLPTYVTKGSLSKYRQPCRQEGTMTAPGGNLHFPLDTYPS